MFAISLYLHLHVLETSLITVCSLNILELRSFLHAAADTVLIKMKKERVLVALLRWVCSDN